MQLQRKEGRKSEGEMIEGWREKEKKRREEKRRSSTIVAFAVSTEEISVRSPKPHESSSSQVIWK